VNIFARITKIDAAKREVHGVMAEEAPDRAGEIFDYASSKPYVKAWSDEAVKQTALAGQDVSFGNVRSQHNPKIAAGKLVSIDFDDRNKKIPVIARIVDDGEWQKVAQGVYTGFSIGGDYVKRWTDGGNVRYTARPKEVSIVDNPCMPGATFTMVKADGAEETRPFADLGTRIARLAKLVDSLPEPVTPPVTPDTVDDALRKSRANSKTTAEIDEAQSRSPHFVPRSNRQHGPNTPWL
jgi:hypothetical protein